MLAIDQFTDMLETFERASPKKTLRHGFERLIGSGELKLFCEARSRLLGIGFGTLTTAPRRWQGRVVEPPGV